MTTTTSITAAQEIIQKASMINIFGVEINVYATMLLISFFGLLYAIYKANKSENNSFEFSDLLMGTNQITGKREASIEKILQLVGGATGTFAVVKLTLQGVITWDIFGIYLTYVAGVNGFSKFMLARYGIKSGYDSNEQPSQTGSAKAN